MTGNNGILKAIGNTPLIKLNHIVPENSAEVYVKLENVNPSGSYKDRMALSMIEEAERTGKLKPGMTVIECTAGSTGTSPQKPEASRELGHPVVREVGQLPGIGAEVVELPEERAALPPVVLDVLRMSGEHRGPVGKPLRVVAPLLEQEPIPLGCTA